MDVLDSFRSFLTRPMVRPWALAAPILVLLICLPLLRPLRHPDPRLISDDELARLATVESLAERRTLSIDDSSFAPSRHTFRNGDQLYSDQPPVLAVLLAGPYWVMQRFDLTFQNNPALVAYLLTILGVTIPVAGSAGLIYRLGRMFELRRPHRALLSAGVVLGSGLVSYGVVLNAHAPAAALLLGAVACIVHVAISHQPRATTGWLAIAGMCAALAATIDPAAAIFLLLLAASIPMMRWRVGLKVGGLTMYALGAAAPIVLHAQLVTPVTGSLLPPALHQQWVSGQPTTTADAAQLAGAALVDAPSPDEVDEVAVATSGWWNALGRNLARVAVAFFGPHGIFTHFPVLLLGIFGVFAVMHRHWPGTTKALATATCVGGLVVVLACCVVTPVGPGEMFGPQAFVVFLPLLMMWSGAWLRRPHGPVKLTLAVLLLVFSVAVGLIGATNPYPRGGYDRYSVAQALSDLVRPESVESPPVLAGR